VRWFPSAGASASEAPATAGEAVDYREIAPEIAPEIVGDRAADPPGLVTVRME